MQAKKIKKFSVLITLFVLPLVTYLFFARAVHSFANLPTVNENALALKELPDMFSNTNISLDNKITIITFFGRDVTKQKVFAFNLKEKIYDKNKDFADFQIVSIADQTQKEEVKEFLYEINLTSDAKSWHFAMLPEEQVQNFIKELTNNKVKLDEKEACSYAFIVDKNGNLRGRLKDKDYGEMMGYNIESVADLNNKMVDDVRVILAEYRLELKKYKADR